MTLAEKELEKVMLHYIRWTFWLDFSMYTKIYYNKRISYG